MFYILYIATSPYSRALGSFPPRLCVLCTAVRQNFAQARIKLIVMVGYVWQRHFSHSCAGHFFRSSLCPLQCCAAKLCAKYESNLIAKVENVWHIIATSRSQLRWTVFSVVFVSSAMLCGKTLLNYRWMLKFSYLIDLICINNFSILNGYFLVFYTVKILYVQWELDTDGVVVFFVLCKASCDSTGFVRCLYVLCRVVCSIPCATKMDADYNDEILLICMNFRIFLTSSLYYLHNATRLHAQDPMDAEGWRNQDRYRSLTNVPRGWLYQRRSRQQLMTPPSPPPVLIDWNYHN